MNEIFLACRMQVNLSEDGLRERGLGSCSSKINWSLPQYGHFNVLAGITRSLFSVLAGARADVVAVRRMPDAVVAYLMKPFWQYVL